MDKIYLSNLLTKGYSIKDIAINSNKSPTTIRYWMKKYDFTATYTEVKNNNTVLKLKQAVKISNSLTEVCERLHYASSGNSRQRLSSLISSNNIDIKHFSSRVNKKARCSLYADDILVYNRRNGLREKQSY